MFILEDERSKQDILFDDQWMLIETAEWGPNGDGSNFLINEYGINSVQWMPYDSAPAPIIRMYPESTFYKVSKQPSGVGYGA